MAMRDHRASNYHPDATFVVRHKGLYFAGRRAAPGEKTSIIPENASRLLDLSAAFNIAHHLTQLEQRRYEVCVRMPAWTRKVP